MLWVYREDKSIPIKMWLTQEDMGQNTLDQALHLSKLPFAFHHVAIMPDAHQGYGMPIGGVLATKGVVIPNAVGVDIGCGMCAMKLPITEIGTSQLKSIMGDIRKHVPVGFAHHDKPQTEDHMPPLDVYSLPRESVVKNEYENARTQVGTLGGGNHFIEIQKGSDGHIWVMIHSGSRNLGLKVAEYYNKLAVKLNERWHSEIPKEWELAFLPFGTLEYENYLSEMNYCVDFALANRRLMMMRICNTIYNYIRIYGFGFSFSDMINIAHNYVAMENHFGENVMVHRKGATRAYSGQLGIIPGSQGTASYIVAGLGNKESFMSCSHGAGRKMGRKEAQKTLDLEAEKKILDDQGIIHSVRNVSDLDEASGAYKDIGLVMANQADLVRIVVQLKPLAVIKG